MTQKNSPNGIDLLLKIMSTLRSPDGCPWDAEQTPESLAPYILEEACELIDAIESGDRDEIRDELGDLLLQVVFQAQIFHERGIFNFADVADAINEKLIRRHPHVFEEGHAEKDNEELHRQWDEIKRRERGNNKSCLADHLPRHLPALQKAQKLISKLHKTGQADKLPAAGPSTAESAADLTEEALGQLLLQIVNQAHLARLDAESALRRALGEVAERCS